MSIRSLKREARTELHRHLAVPAKYLVPLGSGNYQATDISVRVHTSFDSAGDQPGTNFASAERRVIVPHLIFFKSQLPTIDRNAIVSVEAGEAYAIDHIYPADDLTVKAEVKKLRAAETTALPIPDPDAVIDPGSPATPYNTVKAIILTRAEYDALTVKDPETIYYIKD